MALQFKVFSVCAAAAVCTMLAGCQTLSNAWDTAAAWTPTFLHPYRPDVHQGNLITSEMIGQLEIGMSPEQVLFLLGRPLLQDVFHKTRWDYVYYLNKRNGETEIRKLTVYFGNDARVARWEADQMPDETTADRYILTNKKIEAGKIKESAAKEAAKAPDNAEQTAEPRQKE